MSHKIKTRFLLLSDTHGRAPLPSTAISSPCRLPLPPADVAIHTGDLTMNGSIPDHEKALSLLTQLQADLKLVIPGNHDLTLDTAYYANKGHLYGPRPKYTAEQLQHIRNLYTGPEAEAANIVYLEEGTRTFRLKNGAILTVYASAYTPEFCDWAFAYPRDFDRFNRPDAETRVLDYEVGGSRNVDVMLTHGPPFGMLDKVDGRFGSKDMNVGCENLFRAVARSRPLLHCFGHIHEGWGAVRKVWSDDTFDTEYLTAETVAAATSSISVDKQSMVDGKAVLINAIDLKRGCETLFVNSSVLDINYKPTQAPYIVDIALDPSKD